MYSCHCLQCGQPFAAANKGRRFCSPACYRAARKGRTDKKIDPADPESVRRYHREWQRAERAKNPERARARGRSPERRAYQRRYAKEWAKKNPEKYQAQLRRNHAARLRANETYRLRHPDRAKAQRQGWKQKNREKVLSQQRAGYAKNKDQRRTYAKAYYKKNKTKLIAQRKAREAQDPDRHKLYRAVKRTNRRAAIRNVPGPTDAKAYEAFLKWMRSDALIPCYWCGIKTRKGERQVDHVIPVSKGGADDVHNLCCACEHCNKSKNNKLPHHFCGQHVLPFGLPPSP